MIKYRYWSTVSSKTTGRAKLPECCRKGRFGYAIQSWFKRMSKEKKSINVSDIIWSLLCYFPILFLIPLLKKKKASFVAYHTNQGVVLFIVEFCCCTALTILGFILKFSVPTLFFVIRAWFGIALVIFLFCHVLGIIHVCCNQKKGVPIFGEIKLFPTDENEE